MIRAGAAAAACAACLLLTGCAAGGSAPTFTLSLVGTNDLHGGVIEENGQGGLALLDGYLSNLRAARARDGGAVLLVDAGDLFQGTLESNLNEGAVVVDAYNAMGYQAATIGNHEFDYGPAGPGSVPRSADDDPRGALKARLAQAHFLWVAANLIDLGTGKPVAWPNLSPSVLLTVNGVKIGVVGLITRPGLSLTMAANVNGLSVAPLETSLISEATRLREQGASIVIGLAHAGGRCAETARPDDLSSCEADAEIFQVARALPRGLVDAIVSGHRHDQLAQEVNGVPVIESFRSGRAFGRIDLTVDRTSGRATAHHIFQPQELCAYQAPGVAGCASPSASGVHPAEYEGQPVTPSQRIAAILEPAVAATAALKARPLDSARFTAPLTRDSDGQSPVGDLEADWMKAVVPGADVALTNSGGLRADLPQGPLTYGRLYELLPFDNQRVVITLTGAQLRRVIAHNLQTSGSMIVLSGVRASAACSRGELGVTLRRDNGAPIRDDHVLRVVTTDFLSTGGDGFFDPVMPLHIESTGDVLREELAAMLTATGGSWGEERLTLPPRIAFAGTRPVSCE
jgi:5'-nucleotidase